MALGATHACATSNGSLFCWGEGTRGQTSHGTMLTSPTLVTSGYSSTSTVTASAEGTCITIDSVNEVSCMGSDGNEELGNGPGGGDTFSLAPTTPFGAVNQLTSSASARHVCAIATDGTLYCWGANGGGQLGSTGGDIATPTTVPWM